MKMKYPNFINKILYLEDLRAIKNLKNDYALGCDEVFCRGCPEPLLGLFTPDAVWDVGRFGRFEGVGSIKECLEEIRESYVYSIHYFTNPRIDIQGYRAEGRWNLWALYTDVKEQDLILTGTEDDNYQKFQNKWFIKEMRLDVHFQAPLFKGWHGLIGESL